MRRALALAALLLLAPLLAFAAAPEVPVLARHVTDQTGTLTAPQLAELEATLSALEQRKGSQVMVLMVPTTGEAALEDYSLAVAEKNRIGRKDPDDGLLLFIAKDDRKARIEVGYGLEGAVTDALSSRVIREYLAPHFRKGEYFEGIRDATGVLAGLVEGEALPAPMAPAEAPAGGGSVLMPAAILGLFVGLFLGRTGLRPAFLRRLGAGGLAAGAAWLLLSAGLAAVVAALVAFLVSSAGGGRFGSGRGAWGSFPGGGWGGGGFGGGSSGGGWSGGGGGFGGGGASGGW